MLKAKPSSGDASIRVLHVDDEPNQLRFTKQFLEMVDPNLQVTSTMSPLEALEEYASFDCIVSDYMMPEMDGIELAGRVRGTSDIPFIVYTGRGSEEVAEKAFSIGVDDYLRKETHPSHYQVLAKRLRAAVEKYRIETELIESERKYRTLVQNSRDGILLSTGRELVFANKQAALIHGCDSVEELMEQEPSDILHPEDRKYVEDMFLALQRGEEVPPLIEHRIVLPDGTVRNIQSYGSLIQYAGKSSTLVFVRDITKRKRLEEIMRHERDNLLRIMDSTVDGMYIVNQQYDIEYMNPVLREEYGPSRGRKCYEYFQDRGEVCPGCRNEEVFAGKSVRWEWYFPKKDSTYDLVDVPLINPDGSTAKLGILRDITERKVMEDKLREYADHLETLAEKKTSELVDAERMAAAGRIASMVGHDLRGPLQTIKNAIYLLGHAPEEKDELLRVMNNAVDFAVDMIKELHTSTRDVTPQVQEADVGAIVQRVVAMASLPDSVEVETQMGEGLEAVPLDPVQIRRVLDNLVRNAVEAMPEGGRLSIAGEVKGGVLYLSVSDTGVGIPEDELPDIFTLFKTTKPSGLGLGLAFCKRAVEAHGGSIGVESKAGEGTTLTITLPVSPS